MCGCRAPCSCVPVVFEQSTCQIKRAPDSLSLAQRTFTSPGPWLLGGSGFLAIFIIGAIVGNTSLSYSDDINKFHDGIAWLSQIGMFLMLGLLITPTNLIPIIIPALAIAFVLIFIARPLAVFLSLIPFHFPWREQVFIGWCGLRGACPYNFSLISFLSRTRTYSDLL